ncbi:MAG TPA: type II CAAX endopeptidase family protein [Limnochordales bacterium]|nr:type II CAAX endopeptidase family protein [Limnochordales bacterium]
MPADSGAGAAGIGKPMLQFLAITFGLTWGLALLVLMFPQQIVALFGEIHMGHPLFILAVYSPGIAGVIGVWRLHGSAGVGRFLRRLTLWRAPAAWWLFLVAGIPAIMYAGAAVAGTAGQPFPFIPWYQVFPALLQALFLGPVEELGWRGLALPLLQRRMAPLWAGLLLGFIWAVWHAPAFLIGGTPQSAWDFAPYFLGVIAISVVMTGLANATQGSLLTDVFCHFQFNNPIWPDAQPWDTYFLVGAAAIIVWMQRETMLRRDGSVKSVLAPAAHDAVAGPKPAVPPAGR